MIVVACVEAAALVVVVIAFLRFRASEIKVVAEHRAAESLADVEARAAQEAAWATERRELLTRLQHPELIPTAPRADFKIPDPEPDFSALVGTISDDGSEN